MAQPRRIAGPDDLEYQRLYMFYQRLEQRERLRRLPTLTAIALLISAPIMLSVFSWAVAHQPHQPQIAATSVPIAE